MKTKHFVLTAVMFGFFGCWSQQADASPWNKLTRLTVHETIQVPGATLTPGEYVIKLADSQSNRHIVQFFNEDQSKIYSTVLAIPNERMNDEIRGDTQLLFYETRGDAPPALRAWFYPGDTFGQEFVYPKSEAQVIASRSNRNVPTMDDDASQTLKVRTTADQAPDFSPTTRVYIWTPAGREGSDADRESDFARDRSQNWRSDQRNMQRYGRFHNDSSSATSSTTTHSSTTSSNTTTSSHTPADQQARSYVVTRGIILPANISMRNAEIETVMRQIEQHGDQFEDQFKNALNSSTVKFEDRNELRRMVDRLEDTVDNLQKEYKKNDFKDAHEELRKALEIGASVNRFMLRSEFGTAEQSWNTLRTDLNNLAAAHTFPVIQVFTIQAATNKTR